MFFSVFLYIEWQNINNKIAQKGKMRDTNHRESEAATIRE